MVSLLIRLAVLIFLFYLARTIFRNIFGKLFSPKPQSGPQTRVIRGMMMKDPICGTYVDVQVALTSRKDDKNFYFCSEACRQRFGANVRH